MDQRPNFLREEDRRATGAYLERLRAAGIPVVAAYVFGSRAKGQNHKWSDLDLCVVSKIFGHDRQAERVNLLNLRVGISNLIEPHPYSPSDLENRFDPLAQQIVNTGFKIT